MMSATRLQPDGFQLTQISSLERNLPKYRQRDNSRSDYRVLSADRRFRWRRTDSPHYVAEKGTEAGNENAWAFWLKVERALDELLAEAPPLATQH